MNYDLDIIDTLIKIFTGLAGVFVGRYLAKNKERITLAFDFHKELNNTEMSKHRHNAWEFIKQHPTSTIPELEAIDEDKTLCVYVVMRFYQRLWLAIKYKQLSTKVARELFSANFYTWYYEFFEKNAVPLGWWSTDQIKDLASWFEKKLSEDDHTRMKLKAEANYQKKIEVSRQANLSLANGTLGDREHVPKEGEQPNQKGE